MNIAVCIKSIPVSESVSINPENHCRDHKEAAVTMNPADMNALTFAVDLKKKCNAHLDVFSMGAPQAVTELYTAIAMGADEGYLISDRSFAGSDALGTAKVLSEAIAKTKSYDLILCGSISADGATGQVGPMMGAFLDIPSVTDIRGIDSFSDSSIEIYKTLYGKTAHLKLSFPCLLTIELGSNKVILPTLRNRMKAKKKEIHTVTNEILGLSSTEIGYSGAKSLVNDVYHIAPQTKESIWLKGTAEEQAAAILKLLQERGE